MRTDGRGLEVHPDLYVNHHLLPLSGRLTFVQHETSTLPILRENRWVKEHISDLHMYYVTPTARIVTMWNDRLFHAVSSFKLEQHKDTVAGAPERTE